MFSGHDESLVLKRPGRSISENVTRRRERSAVAVNISSEFRGNDTFTTDILYLDNIRFVVREELQVAINEHLTNVISGTVLERIISDFCSAIIKLTESVCRLE